MIPATLVKLWWSCEEGRSPRSGRQGQLGQNHLVVTLFVHPKTRYMNAWRRVAVIGLGTCYSSHTSLFIIDIWLSFGEEEPDQEEQTTYRDDFDDEPATVFIFNYTSLGGSCCFLCVPNSRQSPIPDSLWAMNVAPRTSSQTLADDTARIREIEVIFFALAVSFPSTYFLKVWAPAFACQRSQLILI
jgi:hypothetical protein